MTTEVNIGISMTKNLEYSNKLSITLSYVLFSPKYKEI